MEQTLGMGEQQGAPAAGACDVRATVRICSAATPLPSLPPSHQTRPQAVEGGRSEERRRGEREKGGRSEGRRQDCICSEYARMCARVSALLSHVWTPACVSLPPPHTATSSTAAHHTAEDGVSRCDDGAVTRRLVDDAELAKDGWGREGANLTRTGETERQERQKDRETETETETERASE